MATSLETRRLARIVVSGGWKDVAYLYVLADADGAAGEDLWAADEIERMCTAMNFVRLVLRLVDRDGEGRCGG